jgi:hypothetical protein
VAGFAPLNTAAAAAATMLRSGDKLAALGRQAIEGALPYVFYPLVRVKL